MANGHEQNDAAMEPHRNGPPIPERHPAWPCWSPAPDGTTTPARRTAISWGGENRELRAGLGREGVGAEGLGRRITVSDS
jgi:hypothetical protein